MWMILSCTRSYGGWSSSFGMAFIKKEAVGEGDEELLDGSKILQQTNYGHLYEVMS